MNRALILLFQVGALTVTPGARLIAAQGNTQTTANPQPQATNQVSSHDRHHTKHSSSSGRRHHRHHKTSAKR
jgi:hypothetical protein